MHPNPAFRGSTTAHNLAFARERGFGTLAVDATGGPCLAHIPFLLSDDGERVDLHLVRSNPILAELSEPQPAVLAVTGPDAYISPEWYGDDSGQVPTWNYVAVHLRGTLERRPECEMESLLARQSAALEERLAPKTAWTLDKLDAPTLKRNLRMIVPVRLHIESVDGTWKLGQNKAPGQRASAAAEIGSSLGHEIEALSALMRAVSPKEGE